LCFEVRFDIEGTMSNNPEHVEPLPCPFCEGQAELRETQRIGSESRWHRVECLQCDATGPEIEGCSFSYFGRDRINEVANQALTAWNTRAIVHPERVQSVVDVFYAECEVASEQLDGASVLTLPAFERAIQRWRDGNAGEDARRDGHEEGYQEGFVQGRASATDRVAAEKMAATLEEYYRIMTTPFDPTKMTGVGYDRTIMSNARKLVAGLPGIIAALRAQPTTDQAVIDDK
jgi:Lar family restriction alleviation protein